MSFAERLIQEITRKQSHVVVGLDPVYERLPASLRRPAATSLRQVAEAVVRFNQGIIDAVADLVAVVKPQIAFYERYGWHGVAAYADTVTYARQRGLLVIADVKRNDIGSTAAAYADAHLGRVTVAGREHRAFEADAATVTPYLGADGIDPFLEACRRWDKGLFVLVKTSNPSSGQLQDLVVTRAGEQRPLAEEVARLVCGWGRSCGLGAHGYSPVGAVVGATYPEHARRLRSIMAESFFLVPGYGTQGGTAADVLDCFNEDGYGALISASRSVLYAFAEQHGAEPDFAAAARAAVQQMNADINGALQHQSLLAW